MSTILSYSGRLRKGSMVVAIGIFTLIVLGALAAALGTRRGTAPAPAQAGPKPRGEPCPLCGSPLVRGERVHGVVYKSSSADKIMDIYGCPYCYKEHPAGGGKHRYERRCPVCRKPLGPGETVTARMFDRPDKVHVHVLGCLKCRR